MDKPGDLEGTQYYDAKAGIEELDFDMEPQDEDEDDPLADDECENYESEDDEHEGSHHSEKSMPEAALPEADVAAGTSQALWSFDLEDPDDMEAMEMLKEAFFAGAKWMRLRLSLGGHQPDDWDVDLRARLWTEALCYQALTRRSEGKEQCS
jgi:hypothetical protein